MPNLKNYLTLCKPRVVALMIVTAWTGMLLATKDLIPWDKYIYGTIGITFTASAAAVLNQLIDKKLDAKMFRTKLRPLVTGNITITKALVFAIILGVIGLSLLSYKVNTLTAILTFGSLVGYAFFYTIYLKHATPQNIVIGGIAGAMPPLLGWTAVTGAISPYSLLLVLIIFTWTPPHFWALAIAKKEDYFNANIPMLPVTHGIRFTKLYILLYTILLIIVSSLPAVLKLNSYIYLSIATLANFRFLLYAIQLYRQTDKAIACKTFKYSITYLIIIFSSLILDHYI